MNQKTLVIAVIIVVAVVAVGVGVYLATLGGGGGGGGGTTPNIAGATSLQFSIDLTSGGSSLGTYTYMAKNIGTSSMMIRVEITSADGDLIYIVNGAQQKAWGYASGEWMDLSDTFSDQWNSWNSTWVGYRDSLVGWAGVGDWTYTAPNGDSVRVYDIAVNPSLADSLFEHS
jgi:FlaG/FlaF family flagellin (archaellin)